MRRSLYAFWISQEAEYNTLSKELEELVKENKPDLDKEETEGFIKFEKFDGHIYFEFYFSFKREKADPAGIGTYFVPVKVAIPIALIKDPFMLVVFTRNSAQRDKILSSIPLKPEHREGFTVSSDFIEFLNVPKPEDWAEEVLGDTIEPRGRKGHASASKTHTVTERYPGPEERDIDLEKEGKNYVFRDFAEVNVSSEETSIKLTLYPTGKVTVHTLGQEEKVLAPYIAKALKAIKDAESRYLKLKGNIQGERDGKNES